MKIQDVKMTELRKMLRAAEQVAGADSFEAKALRKELARRRFRRRQKGGRRG